MVGGGTVSYRSGASNSLITALFVRHESSAPMPMAGSLPNKITACRKLGRHDCYRVTSSQSPLGHFYALMVILFNQHAEQKNMNEYIFLADLLNKFSQLTPWVQAVIGISVSGMILGIAYFFKESITAIMKPLYKTTLPNQSEQKEEKKEWRDKYYRGGEQP